METVHAGKIKTFYPKDSSAWTFFTYEGRQVIFRKLRRFSNWAPNSFELFRNDPPSILHFVKVTPTRFRLLWKLRILPLKIIPKFTTYFIFSHVYEINFHNLRLRHSISNHAYYCFVLLSWNLLKWLPFNTPLSENDPPAKWPAPLTGYKRTQPPCEKINLFLSILNFWLIH